MSFPLSDWTESVSKRQLHKQTLVHPAVPLVYTALPLIHTTFLLPIQLFSSPFKIREDQFYCHLFSLQLQYKIGMRCDGGSSYMYFHMTIHSHAPNDYDKIYYVFKINK